MTEQQKKRSAKGSARRTERLGGLTDRMELLIEALQVVIAILVIIGFCASIGSLFFDMKEMAASDTSETFRTFLGHAFNLVIGLEFVRMLIKHTPSAALEVLLFAIARHMVLDGSSGLDLIFGVASIAGIFAIRKYLYVSSFESREDRSSFEWFASGGKSDSAGGNASEQTGENESSDDADQSVEKTSDR